LEECKLLDINDFLHNVSPYVVNRYVVSRLRPQYRAPPTGAPQLAPSLAVLPVHFIESNIFESVPVMMHERSPDTLEDLPNWGTTFSGGRARFEQFGTMEGAVLRSKSIFSPSGREGTM
jgi:hypothetical protein